MRATWIDGNRRRDVAMLLIRGMVGLIFAYHGSQKLFGAFGGPGLTGFAGFLATLGIPLPGVNAVLAGSAEFFGGLALVAGVGVRTAGFFLVATMAVASYAVHGHGFSVQNGGMEYPLTLAVIVLGIALNGPGGLTLTPEPRLAWGTKREMVAS